MSPDEKFFTVTVQTNHGLVFDVTVPDFSHPQQSPTALPQAEKAAENSTEVKACAVAEPAYA